MHAPIRILIVEDEAILAEDLRESLERQSYRVIDVVDNAAAALAVVQAQQPDLTMMDIHLAGEDDGISVAAQIREQFDIPIIFLTAHSDHATLDRAKQTSPYGYLVKPFEEQELRAAIETAIYRHQSDAQLRNMERWLRTTLHSIGDGVLTVDLDRRVTFINPIAESITGWSRQDAIGSSYTRIFALRDPQEQLVADPIARVLDAGDTLHFDTDHQIDTRNGERRRIDDSIAPIRDATGTITGAIIIFRDATERWQLEQVRLREERRMQEAQRLESLGVLAAGIAHDFNNLLAIIMGHSELVADSSNLQADQVDSIHEVRNAARRASHLCDQMLSYADAKSIELKPLHVHTIIDQTSKLLPSRLPFGIQVRLHHQTSETCIHGHPGRLQQLFSNIVHNAVEAMEEQPGHLTITTSYCPRLPAGLRIPPPDDADPAHWLQVSFQDEGPGMEPATIERMFNPFFSTKFTGRGLGLSIAFNVIRQHHGALGVCSSPGQGTRMDVYLPLCAQPTPASPTAPAIPGWRPEDPGRILIIDDEDNVRRVLSAHLRHFGYTTVDTAHGGEAVSLLQSHPDITAVFLDLTMPDISGVEVLQLIRADYPQLPVVFVSGFSQDAIAGVLDTDTHTSFLQKPFTRAELTSALVTLP